MLHQTISELELQKILERGLTGGYWSIDQFNRGVKPPVFPRPGFLAGNPQFYDKGFRDIQAYRNNHANQKGVFL